MHSRSGLPITGSAPRVAVETDIRTPDIFFALHHGGIQAEDGDDEPGRQVFIWRMSLARKGLLYEVVKIDFALAGLLELQSFSIALVGAVVPTQGPSVDISPKLLQLSDRDSANASALEVCLIAYHRDAFPSFRQSVEDSLPYRAPSFPAQPVGSFDHLVLKAGDHFTVYTSVRICAGQCWLTIEGCSTLQASPLTSTPRLR